MKRLKAFAAAVSLAGTGAEKKAPTEFRLLKAGENTVTKIQLDGSLLKTTILFDEAAAKAVMAAKQVRTVRPAIDYGHEELSAAVREKYKEAAGSFDFEVRDGDLWAVTTTWTEDAATLIVEGKKLYFSPVLGLDAEGRVTDVLLGALTNFPAIDQIPALMAASVVAVDRRTAAFSAELSFDTVREAVDAAVHARWPSQEMPDYKPGAWLCELYDTYAIIEYRGRLFQVAYTLDGTKAVLAADAVEVTRTYAPIAAPAAEEGTETMKTLLSAMSLQPEATEAEALSTLTRLQDEKRRLDDQVKEVLALTGKATLSEAKGVIEAGKQSVATVESQAKEIATMKASETEREVVALVDKASVDGKIPPAKRDEALAMGRKDVAMLRSFIGMLPVQALGASDGPKPPTGSTTVVTLTAEDRAVMKQLGIDEKAFSAQKAARAAAAERAAATL